MKIHTDTLMVGDMYAACGYAGFMAGQGQVNIADCASEGSRTHAYGYKVYLVGDGTVSRRAPNRRNEDTRGEFAATYDSWGHYLAYLFHRDPGAKAGPYKDATHFHETTQHVYEVTRG